MLVLLAALTVAHAEVVPQFAAGVTYGINSASGPIPPSMGFGVGIFAPLAHNWAWYSEASVGTGFTELAPGLLLLTGPSKKLAPGLALGASVLYKVTPGYDGDATSHIVGGSIVPIFPREFGGFSFPLSLATQIGTPGMTGTLSIKVAIK